MSVPSQYMQQQQSPTAGYLGDIGGAAGLYMGLTSGTPQGDVSAAANAAKLAGTVGGQTGYLSSLESGDLAKFGTGALDALGVYQGLEQGGWQGYGRAAGSAIQGAGLALGDNVLSGVGGAILAPIDVYSAIKNYQSGATGSDALQDAEAGAAVGSMFGPIGTGVGAVIGGAVGAISSAFGGGRPDPETGAWNNYASTYDTLNPTQQKQLQSELTPQEAFENLAGVMDAKNNTAGHSEPIEQVFGREGEGNLVDQLTGYLNQEEQAGKITPGESISQQYSSIVNPWLTSKGAAINPNAVDAQGQNEGKALVGDIQSLMGDWETGQLTGKTAVGVDNQTLGSALQAYKGKAPSLATPISPQEQAQTNAVSNMYGRPTTPVSGNLPTATNKAPTTGGFTPQASPGMPQANEYGLYPMAEGGSMKKRRKSALQSLYEGPDFAERQRLHFDDGGSAYLSYAMPAGSYLDTTPTIPTLTDEQVAAMGPTSQDLQNEVGNSPDVSVNSTFQNEMANAKANLTGDNGITGILKSVGALAPLAGLLLGATKGNTKTPTAVPGMTQGATNPKAPVYTRSQVTGTPSTSSGTPITQSPLGSIGSPSNMPGGAPMSLQDWYTYGSRPEATFFNNNSVPLAQATGVAQGIAHGGQPRGALDALHDQPEFDSTLENHVEGPGDGTSDDIPAQLSDGEYVMDANTVSMLGNGSNKAGAQRLDQLRENLRKHAAKPMSKGKQFMKAKPPEKYLPRKGKGKPVAFHVEGEG